MRSIKNSYLVSGGILTIAVMGANAVNFIFNIFLGRALSFEEFGAITFISTLFYVGNIFYNALFTTMNQEVSQQKDENNSLYFENLLSYMNNKLLVINFFIVLFWCALIPLMLTFFHISSIYILLPFSLIILFYPSLAINKGYLQGKFLFVKVALLIISEPVIKLLIAAILFFSHLESFTYLALYFAPLITVLLGLFIVIKNNKISKYDKSIILHFPIKFFFGALLAGLSTLSFLALDFILVKHFLNPTLAGQYALLSLIGKIIFFLGSLLSIFIISVVNRDEANKKNSLVSYYKILFGSVILGGIGYLIFGIYGRIFIPYLFGEKALSIFPYLRIYSLAILLFTLANSLVIYHLAKKQFIFPVTALTMSVFMIIGILIYHQNIQNIINLILSISIIDCVILSLLHIKKRNQSGKIILNDLSTEGGIYG